MPASVKPRLRFLRVFHDPLSIILILGIVVAVLGAGVIGAEIYTRKRADKLLAAAFECELKDQVKVSIGVGPTPFLLQYLTNNYTDISVHTAGNQVRTAKGMTANLTLNDVDLAGKGNSKGTIGVLDANVIWTSGGIKSTLEEGIPFLKEGLIESVSTNASAGTFQLSGAWGLASVTLKPQVADGGLSLEVTKLTAMGAAIPHEVAQTALNAFNKKLVKSFPLGLRADNVRVTNEGVAVHLSKHNAAIPANDPCFAHI
jgi:LmeA-like phospholipid-binding